MPHVPLYTVQLLPGTTGYTCVQSLQIVATVRRVRLDTTASSWTQQLAGIFGDMRRALCCRVEPLGNVALCDLRYDIQLPEDDIVQIALTGSVVFLHNTPHMPVYAMPKEPIDAPPEAPRSPTNTSTTATVTTLANSESNRTINGPEYLPTTCMQMRSCDRSKSRRAAAATTTATGAEDDMEVCVGAGARVWHARAGRR